MNACLYIGNRNNEWIREIFPGKSPAEMPVAGKSWARHAVDLCSQLKVSEIFVADRFFYPDLVRRLGDGAYWSTKIRYRSADEISSPAALPGQFPKPPADDDDLLIFWGQVLPDLEEIDRLFDRLEPVTAAENPPDGIYLRRGGEMLRCVCPLHRMDTIKNYFDLNLKMLNRPGIYNLPGYSSERGFFLGSNVITMFGCRLETPLIVQDNSCLGRSTVLDGEVIIGKNVLIDDFSHLKRAVILDNTYVGRNMWIENKIIAGRTVIDVETGVHAELEDEFLVGQSVRRKLDRYTLLEFLFALFLLLALLPGYLLGRLFRKRLAKLPFFDYVLGIYPKLPRVITGHAKLICDGDHGGEYVFRFADQWPRMTDEHYRDFADMFYLTHRNLRYMLATILNSLIKRMFILTPPGGGTGAPKP